MDDSSIVIKICPYLKELIEIRDDLSHGILALSRLHSIYSEDDSPFSSDDFLETRDLLEKMQCYVADDTLRIIESRIAQSEKGCLDRITVHKQS